MKNGLNKKIGVGLLSVALLAATIVQSLQIPPLNRTNLSKTT